MPSVSAIAATSFAVWFASQGWRTVLPWTARSAAMSSSAICEGPSSPIDTPACDPLRESVARLIAAMRTKSYAREMNAANVDATIQYFGHNFFLITTSKGTRIVTDPLGPGWYPNPNVIGDVVTVGKEMFNHNAVQIVLGNPVILRGLTNYGADWNKVSTSVKDTLIYNVPIHQNAEIVEGIKGSAFVFDLGTLCIAHLGDLSQKLNEQQIKAFGKEHGK